MNFTDLEMKLNLSDSGSSGMVFFNGNVWDESVSIKAFLSIYLGMCMSMSLIGNVCTCAVITRDRTMRTPTNCYLFNLAITDFLFSLFIPMDIYFLWTPDHYPLGEMGCRLHFFLFDCLSNCSALTIAAFTVERYLVVSKPFLRQKLSETPRVFKIIALIWGISVLFCVPDFFHVHLLDENKLSYCYLIKSNVLTVVIGIEQLVFFVTPMTTICALYIFIALKLKSGNKLRSSPVHGNQNRDKAVKMLAAVAASFFFSWSPYFLLRFLIMDQMMTLEHTYSIWRVLNYFCYFCYLSTVVNPILYSLMSHKFRHAFKDFLKGRSRNPVDRSIKDSIGHATTTSSTWPISAA